MLSRREQGELRPLREEGRRVREPHLRGESARQEKGHHIRGKKSCIDRAERGSQARFLRRRETHPILQRNHPREKDRNGTGVTQNQKIRIRPRLKVEITSYRQIVHYPENVDIETAKGQSRVVLGSQGVAVKSDAEFRPINPALIYNYSARPESKYNPIGYVDQGQSRVFSNSPTFMAPIDHSEYFYGLQQQQQILPRTNSAQKFETSRVFSPRLQPGPMTQ